MLKVLFFAKIAEIIQTQEIKPKLNSISSTSPSHIVTIEILLDWLKKQYPNLNQVKVIKVAVNHELVQDFSLVLQPNDEVALFEPMTGG